MKDNLFPQKSLASVFTMDLQPDDVDFRYFKLVTLFGLDQIV